MTQKTPALLLIAHGSRLPQANEDLEWVAREIHSRGPFAIVQTSYLELCEPTIDRGGELCVEDGASRVVMLPYFLSAGIHVRDDLRAAQKRLAERFPAVKFELAEPLGRHPLLVEVAIERAAECEAYSRKAKS